MIQMGYPGPPHLGSFRRRVATGAPMAAPLQRASGANATRTGYSLRPKLASSTLAALLMAPETAAKAAVLSGSWRAPPRHSASGRSCRIWKNTSSGCRLRPPQRGRPCVPSVSCHLSELSSQLCDGKHAQQQRAMATCQAPACTSCWCVRDATRPFCVRHCTGASFPNLGACVRITVSFPCLCTTWPGARPYSPTWRVP